ncbi:ankyrin repeat domain-containing protein 50-like isoform X2 [Bacillus rossius redtenbacheri]
MARCIFNSFMLQFGIAGTALAIADPVYNQNSSEELGGTTAPVNTISESLEPNNAVKTLINRYERDGNWTALKSGLGRELSLGSRARAQALSLGDNERYPLVEVSSGASYLDLLGVLLYCGLAPDTVAGPDNRTMLHVSAERGAVPVARALLERGADPDARTAVRDTPLILAAWRDHLLVVQALRQHGADLNSQNDDGRTALHRAAFWGNAEVVRYLVDAGANKTITTKLGNTPLDDARSRGYANIVKMLL